MITASLNIKSEVSVIILAGDGREDINKELKSRTRIFK